MALEKPIIKAQVASTTTFDFKPKEFSGLASQSAKSFVDRDSFRSPDFEISELVAQQAGIRELESDAHQDKINSLVLERLGQVQEKAYEEGYELGLVEGTEKAFQEAKQDLLAKLTTFENMLIRIEEIKGQLLIDNEASLIELSFHIAKRIAMRDIEGNRDAVKEILQSVVGEIQEGERVTVHLSPEDLRFLEGLQEKSGQKIESLKRVRFSPEEQIKSGGCIIDTAYGSVNATVEERVERTWQALLSRIPQKDPGRKE